jgi:hypothetical protein
MILASHGIISSSGTGVPLLLDTYSGAIGAYSLRKIKSTYSGYAIRVRRSSDNNSQDISFDSSGNLDTTSLTSFVGANSGFVSIWYDQSENGHNLIQNTAANQARIVLNGVIETLNGKPALVSRFNSSNNAHYNVTYNSSITSPSTIFHVGSNVGSAASTYLFDSISSSTRIYSTSYNTTWIRIGGSSEFALTGYTQNITTQRIINAIYNGSNSKISINNGAYTTGNTGTSGASGLTLGASYLNALHANAYYQEHIVYPSNQESNVNNIDTNINSYYSIY